MRRILITICLTLLLTNLGTVLAGAQNASSDSDPAASIPGSNLPAPTNPALNAAKPFKLFAGVTHQQMLPWADAALRPHVDKQLKTPVNTGSVKTTATTDVVKPPAPVVPPKPLFFPPKSVLNAETAAKQAYVPAFGVARLTAERVPDPPRPLQHYTVEWFMIPGWMAGVWMKNGDMTTSVTDLRTGMSSARNEWTENKLQAVWGHQQDAQGNYWHVNLLPSERDGASSGKLVRFITVAQQCVNSSPQQLMTRTHYVVSESNPWNNQPIDTFQQESFNHYALAAQNQLVNSSSNRVFTYEGVPVREGTLVSQFAKIGQFTPVASLNGVDLRTSLNDYLQSHALGHLKK
jgi:hypothetical protein